MIRVRFPGLAMNNSEERPPLMRPAATRCDDIVRQTALWTGFCGLLAGWSLARLYHGYEPVERWRTFRFAAFTSVTLAAAVAFWVQRTDPACSPANRAVYGSRR